MKISVIVVAAGLTAACLGMAWFVTEQVSRAISARGKMNNQTRPKSREPSRSPNLRRSFQAASAVDQRSTSVAPGQRRSSGAAASQSDALSETLSERVILDATQQEAQRARELEFGRTIDRFKQPGSGLITVFEACDASACVGRVESSVPAEIDTFAERIKRSVPAFKVRVRERLTAFNGRQFVADVHAPAAMR